VIARPGVEDGPARGSPEEQLLDLSKRILQPHHEGQVLRGTPFSARTLRIESCLALSKQTLALTKQVSSRVAPDLRGRRRLLYRHGEREVLGRAPDWSAGSDRPVKFQQRVNDMKRAVMGLLTLRFLRRKAQQARWSLPPVNPGIRC